MKVMTTEAVNAITSIEDVDIFVIEQHETDLLSCKGEAREVLQELLSLDLEEDDELNTIQSSIEDEISSTSFSLRKLRHLKQEDKLLHGKGVKLPKIDVPKFDGDILNWRTFWEQFDISIHSREDISEAEKLVYLRHSLNEGSAKHTIEGLSRSGDCYDEAVECLQSRYNRPRLIHQTHVRKIMDAPPLKEGNGKELRRLHDTAQQHLRALKAMDHEPSGTFVTSILELKLDQGTMFEWQKYSQDTTDVPHYQKLLEFLDLRAQASETIAPESTRKSNKGDHPSRKPGAATNRSITSYAANAVKSTPDNCVACKRDSHPLYSCNKFKGLSHIDKISLLKSHDLCMNCLKPGHFIKTCKSLHRCKVCQKPHHSLLHDNTKSFTSSTTTESAPTVNPVLSHAVSGFDKDVLLMTCKIVVESPTGLAIEARGILDSASSASFVSERLARTLRLRQSTCKATISGIAGLTHSSSTQSVVTFSISPVHQPSKKMSLSAIVIPRVTQDLPIVPVHCDPSWNHLSDIELADPKFGIPGRVDLLLGVDIFASALRQGRRYGPSNAPIAIETDFGWVLSGSCPYKTSTVPGNVLAHHVSVGSCNDVLSKFWEVEEPRFNEINGPLTSEERAVTKHYNETSYRTEEGAFVVPLPRKPYHKALGESRSSAVRRFVSLERSLHSKSQWNEFESAMKEYFEMKHAELVPPSDLEKPPKDVFYLPMHAVRKECSTTTKLRVVFDASAKSSTGVSLNDTLLVGHTVHSSLTDVLLRFRLHRIALVTDVSKMYRAVHLADSDRDLHRFVWRTNPSEPLLDYRMTRVTFGVSASSFAANMSVKQNALDLAEQYPMAAKAVEEHFYVDDGLTGADSVVEAIELRRQLQEMFLKGGFLLRKWNSSNPEVIRDLPQDLKDVNSSCSLPNTDEYTKTLGVQWNSVSDHFRLVTANLPPLDRVTKRFLVSDVAKTYDVLGWFSPSIVMVKILLQRLWEQKVDWDDEVPCSIQEAWLQWRRELKLLSLKCIPRCYFPKQSKITNIELHGFSDASEAAYAAVVYFRVTTVDNQRHVSLITSKTKVAPIKRLSIPRLELCGSLILARLLSHLRKIFAIPLERTYAWTDSTVVLHWMLGNPRRFKTFVGNRVSELVDLIPPNCWKHVNGKDNPADCASRGLLPSDLIEHDLWWKGPHWLHQNSADWPTQSNPMPIEKTEEEREICLNVSVQSLQPIISFDRYSSYTKLKLVVAWVFRFTNTCLSRLKETQSRTIQQYLTVEELKLAEAYILVKSQNQHFQAEIQALRNGKNISNSSYLTSLNPLLDSSGLLRVGGRQSLLTHKPYDLIHPIILYGDHPLVKLIIRSEHIRLLHAGITLVTASLSRRFHIVKGKRIIRDTIRKCVQCRRICARRQTQKMGNLPVERITPDYPFSKVGIDYAGPFYTKYGYVRKPVIVKTYVCVFVSLTIKAVHLDLVTDLTTEAFIVCLRRFSARRGKPILIMSDNGTNFTGANREMKDLTNFLNKQATQQQISRFCASEHIQWQFIPERSPHFGGLWEAAVKSMKYHLKKVVGEHKLTFEELYTIITQVEACLNSRPLASLPDATECLGALTPGHFLIGRPLESLPDSSTSCLSVSLLKRWQLVQALSRQFWKRWSSEYLNTLQKRNKWQTESPNIKIGDVVIIKEDMFVTPLKWPLARVVQTHPGSDGKVRVVTVKTATGEYKRPIAKLVLLLPSEDC